MNTNQPKHYEPPAIVELGSIADLTRGDKGKGIGKGKGVPGVPGVPGIPGGLS